MLSVCLQMCLHMLDFTHLVFRDKHGFEQMMMIFMFYFIIFLHHVFLRMLKTSTELELFTRRNVLDIFEKVL